MSIYYPHLDAYLCVNRRTKFVFLENLDTIALLPEPDEIGWENWDEYENDDGTKLLFYKFPDGAKWFLTGLRHYGNESFYTRVHLHVLPYLVPDVFCSIENNHLFLYSYGTQYDVATTVIPKMLIAQAVRPLTEEQARSTHMEFHRVAHSLK